MYILNFSKERFLSLVRSRRSVSCKNQSRRPRKSCIFQEIGNAKQCLPGGKEVLVEGCCYGWSIWFFTKHGLRLISWDGSSRCVQVSSKIQRTIFCSILAGRISSSLDERTYVTFSKFLAMQVLTRLFGWRLSWNMLEILQVPKLVYFQIQSFYLYEKDNWKPFVFRTHIAVSNDYICVHRCVSFLLFGHFLALRGTTTLVLCNTNK